jgi:hypothetical protein
MSYPLLELGTSDQGNSSLEFKDKALADAGFDRFGIPVGILPTKIVSDKDDFYRNLGQHGRPIHSKRNADFLLSKTESD